MGNVLLSMDFKGRGQAPVYWGQRQNIVLAATNGGLSSGSSTMLGDQNITFSLEFCQLLTEELVWL